MPRPILVALGAAGLALPALAFAQSTERSVTPIYEVDSYAISNGSPSFNEARYSIGVSIGSSTVAAILDTGSAGLRLLPGTVPSSALMPSDSASPPITYGSGVVLQGPAAEAKVAVGSIENTVLVQTVTSASCPAPPTSSLGCTGANTLPLDEFGLAGEGTANTGFKAIIGIRLENSDIPSTLLALGVHRWIVSLPLPYAGTPGQLILNPSTMETADFVPLTLAPDVNGEPTGQVSGCLVAAPGETPFCAPVLFDTGGPRVTVKLGSGQSIAVNQGGQAMLQLDDSVGHATLGFTVGGTVAAPSLDSVTHSIHQDPVAPAQINIGQLLFFGFDVLFDADADQIAIRPRTPGPVDPPIAQN